jgi:hypothetical protein
MCACARVGVGRHDVGSAFLEKLSLNPTPSRMVIACHGFGCTYRDQLVLTPERLAYLNSLLGSAHSAKEERRSSRRRSRGSIARAAAPPARLAALRAPGPAPRAARRRWIALT